MWRLGKGDAAALVRPEPKRYKNFKPRKKLVPIKRILNELQGKQEKGQARPSGEAALALCLVLPTQPGENGTGWNRQQTASLASDDFKYLQGIRRNGAKDIAEIEPMALISENEGTSYSRSEAWVESKGQQCPAHILQVIWKYRDIFMDTLPPGLPPERVINHTITLLPGKLPSKGAIYCPGPEELEA